jgi:membrane-associated phospholipid phosphatase
VFTACAASVLVSVAAGQTAQPGFLLGDDLRFRRAPPLEFTGRFVVRALADLVAIPASAPRWSAADWALFAGVVVPTVAAAVPVQGRSADARFQDLLHQTRGANCAAAPAGSTVCESARAASFHLWVPASNAIIGVTEIAVPFGLLLVGALSGHDGVLESSTLALEAVLVSQVYHVVLKLLTGREGTLSRSGAGEWAGPTRLHFPDGFPSGHAMTLFSLIGAFGAYVDTWWAHLALWGVGLTLATWLVLDDYHFASEVFFGAATGFLIGRFVVRHRRQLTTPDSPQLEGVAPVVRGQAPGLTLSFSF